MALNENLNMKEINSTICLMSFGKIQETSEVTEFKKYIGIA